MFKKGVSLLIVVTLLITIFAVGYAQKTEEGKEIVWKLGHNALADHVDHKRLVKMAEIILDKTGGKFKIEIYPANQLGDAVVMYEGVQMGSIDVTSLSASAIAGYAAYSKLSVLDAPFIYDDVDHLKRVVKSDMVKDMIEELVDLRNTRIIGMFYAGTRHLTTKNTIVKTPEDAKGLKVRSPDIPIYMDAVRAMGASPTPMAFAELYSGLQQGVVDGQENPYMQIVSMKFYEVQKYLIKTGHITMVGAIIVNEDRYNELPDDYKTILIEACQEGIEFAEQIILEEEVTLVEVLKGFGMEIIEPERGLFIENAEFIKEKYKDQWGEGVYEIIRGL